MQRVVRCLGKKIYSYLKGMKIGIQSYLQRYLLYFFQPTKGRKEIEHAAHSKNRTEKKVAYTNSSFSARDFVNKYGSDSTYVQQDIKHCYGDFMFWFSSKWFYQGVCIFLFWILFSLSKYINQGSRLCIMDIGQYTVNRWCSTKRTMANCAGRLKRKINLSNWPVSNYHRVLKFLALFFVLNRWENSAGKIQTL